MRLAASSAGRRAWLRRAAPGALGLLCVPALLLLFFHEQVFGGGVLAQGDAFLLFYPVWDYRAEAVRAGRIPLWNPLTFMGAPFLANSQYGVLYPPNWPMAWLPAPAALEVSALAHLLLAAAGMALFARRTARLEPGASWLAAGLFTVGGYMLARVEQINQLQGLAWLPWALWAAAGINRAPRINVPLLGLCLAMQFLAGHTQTSFLTGAAVATFLAARGLAEAWAADPGWRARAALRSVARPLLLAGAAAALAFGNGAAQLLPTLELSSESVRAGGLPVSEALSFSLDPRLLGQALLPGYSRPLYSEYAATLGVAGLCLALLGLLRLPGHPPAERAVWLGVAAVAACGLFFALGRYNPLYVALVRYTPGFDFFRAPARWLALWAFGAALLAGGGLQALSAARLRRGEAALCLGAVCALAALAWSAAGLTPAGETGPLPRPPALEAAAWIAAGAGALACAGAVRASGVRLTLLGALAAAELFAGSRLLGYNRLTTPAAYFEARPSVEYLLKETGRAQPGGRVLAQSRLFYDPTRAGIPLPLSENAAGLSPAETYRYVVAAKYQDVLSHNLALRWGIPTADGYDGGILPLRRYVSFAEYLLGRAPLTRDGRLRESLDQFPSALPDGRALSLANVQYLITDQTFDAWFRGVYFDLTHHARLPGGAEAAVADLPAFDAEGLEVLSFLEGAADLPNGAPVAEIEVTFSDGSRESYLLRAGWDTAEGDYPRRGAGHRRALIAGHYWPDRREVNDYWAAFAWNEPRQVKSLAARGLLPEGAVVIRGLTLVNGTEAAFAPLVISSSGRFRLGLRADVKVYENLGVLPRAFLVSQVKTAEDDIAAFHMMQASGFDPARTVVLDAEQAQAETGTGGAAAIQEYAPERVVITTEAAGPAVLVLADAWYPGWTAEVNGTSVPVLRADVLLRAVRLPPGRNTVVFRFEPRSWLAGTRVSVAAALLTLGLLSWGLREARRAREAPSG